VAVVDVVRALQPGEVVTYAEVALEAGRPGSAQAVANVLRRIPGLPWWRVVPSDGRIYRTHAPTQVPLLAAEGIEVDAHRRIVTAPRGAGGRGPERVRHPPHGTEQDRGRDEQAGGTGRGSSGARGRCTP
jgi:methylated-DNA-protein-cysteine methyltransferase related protein